MRKTKRLTKSLLKSKRYALRQLIQNESEWRNAYDSWACLLRFTLERRDLFPEDISTRLHQIRQELCDADATTDRGLEKHKELYATLSK